jgi:agmatinase
VSTDNTETPPRREYFLGAEKRSYEEALIALFGCPFDETVSFRAGARNGPAAIRDYSEVLETYSPEFEKDLGGVAFCDMGDLVLEEERLEANLEIISNRAREVLSAGKVPFALGGEHLVSLPLIVAALEHHPDLVVFQWDAHADLRGDFEGAVLSHATVMRRVVEALGEDRIVQYGIRSGTREEWDWMTKHMTVWPMIPENMMAGLVQHQGRPVYLTVDVDVLDPSECPGTGTPEPGGSTFVNLIACIKAMRQAGAPIIGVDVVELAPNIDRSGISAIATAKLVRELLLSLRI